MKPMKVLIVIANFKIAGAQKMVEQLAIGLKNQPIELKVVCVSHKRGNAIEKKLEENGIDVTFLNKKRGFSLGTFFKMRKIIKTFAPSVIHTNVTTSWIYSFIPAVRYKIPILHTIHSQPKRQEANRHLYRLIKWLYKTGKAHPVAISDEIKKEAEDLYGLKKEQVELIYNPVDYYAFSNRAKTEHADTVYVNVARHEKVKNLDTLIECFCDAHKINEHISLMQAGDGELFKELKDKIEMLDASKYIHMLGNVEDIPALFDSCDVFILTSLSEGLPVSLLEAEAASLPIIASNVGGIPDIVEKNGILTDPYDKKSIVDAILKMADKSLHEEMGKISDSIAAKYKAEVIAEKYMQLYKKYCG